MKIFFILAVISLVATLAVLLFGVSSMGRNSGEGRMRGNKLMRWRIGLQALTIMLLILTAITA
ncbi:MAG: twin transmembrane helix small protein [Kordiimonadaceae bacterium]|nr:twin transmembrane helix small protein [Kordiimonadaceae bacterium]